MAKTRQCYETHKGACYCPDESGGGITPERYQSILEEENMRLRSELARLRESNARLLDALNSALNLEQAATHGERMFQAANPTATMLDVPWHFEKIRAAIAAEGEK